VVLDGISPALTPAPAIVLPSVVVNGIAAAPAGPERSAEAFGASEPGAQSFNVSVASGSKSAPACSPGGAMPTGRR